MSQEINEMPFTLTQLTNIMKPFKGTIKLNVCTNIKRCKISKQNLPMILQHLNEHHANTSDSVSPFLNYVCRYGKESGNKMEFSNKRDNGAHGWGRLTPNKTIPFHTSYVALPRPIRHFLAAGLYTDVDQDNCHPVIIQQLLAIWSKKAGRLISNWNLNRKDIFARLQKASKMENCTKDDCKKVGFTFLYEGNVDEMFASLKVDKDCETIKDIYDLCVQLKTSMIELRNKLKNEFPDVWASLPCDPLKSPLRVDASKFSTFIQHIECHVTRIMIKVAQDAGLEIGDIAHDGLFILNNPLVNADLLKLMSMQIKAQCGLDISLSFKAFSEPEWARELSNERVEIPNAMDAAITLAKLYVDFKYCSGILYVFDSSTGMWSQQDSTILKIASRYAETLGNWVTSPAKFNDVKKFLCTLDLIIDTDWIRRTSNSSLGYLLFSDCIWNFKTATKMAFDKNIVFHVNISRKCPVINDRMIQLKQEVFNLLFKDPLGSEVGAYMCYALSLALAGEREKYIRFLIGMANNGKGILSKALSYALQGYFSTFDASTLMVSQESDAGKRNRPFYLMRYARILMSQELSEGGRKADSNMIKSVSSGGDIMVGRTHGAEEQQFSPHGSFFAALNDMIGKFDKMDEALSNRMMVIPYNVQFYTVAQLSDDDLISEQDKGALKKRAILDLSNRIQSDDYADALVLLLLEAYNSKVEIPIDIFNAKLDWFEDSDKTDLMSIFKETFLLTNDSDDFMKSSDLENWWKDNGTETFQKFRNTCLKKYITENKLHNVMPGKKRRINGVEYRGWSGLKFISTTEELSNCVL